MRANLTVLKPAAQYEAESIEALDELGNVAGAIDLAALAVIGMAEDLGGDEGDLIGNHLRQAADRIRSATARLSPIDMEATKAKLDAVA